MRCPIRDCRLHAGRLHCGILDCWNLLSKALFCSYMTGNQWNTFFFYFPVYDVILKCDDAFHIPLCRVTVNQRWQLPKLQLLRAQYCSYTAFRAHKTHTEVSRARWWNTRKHTNSLEPLYLRRIWKYMVKTLAGFVFFTRIHFLSSFDIVMIKEKANKRFTWLFIAEHAISVNTWLVFFTIMRIITDHHLLFVTFVSLREERQSSFPEIHKVDNVGIFVQLLMQINWRQLRTQWISKQIHFCNGALNFIEVMNFSVYHIFNFKQTQKCQHYHLCVLWENSISDSRKQAAVNTLFLCQQMLIHRIGVIKHNCF